MGSMIFYGLLRIKEKTICVLSVLTGDNRWKKSKLIL